MKIFLTTASLVLATSAAYAQSSPQDFAATAASGGMYEIQSSEMILESGDLDPKVEEFAQQMITDHTKAAEDLAAAAEEAGVDVPAQPMPKEAKKLAALAEADDKVSLYLKQQDTSHNDAVVLHRSYAAAGTDASLKAYAEATVPALEDHDGHIEMLNQEMAK